MEGDAAVRRRYLCQPKLSQSSPINRMQIRRQRIHGLDQMLLRSDAFPAVDMFDAVFNSSPRVESSPGRYDEDVERRRGLYPT